MSGDEGSDEEAPESATGQSSESPSNGASGSRFDEFLDRLDERDAKRDRSDEEPDDEETDERTAKRDGPNQTPDDVFAPANVDTEAQAREEGEAEAESDGWIWGSSRENSERERSIESADGREGATASKRSPERNPNAEPSGGRSDRTGEPPTSPDAGRERLWDAIGEGVTRTGEGASEPNAPNGDVTTDPPDRSPEDEGSSRPEGSHERDGSSEPDGRDRWAELGANLPTGGERDTAGSDERRGDFQRRRGSMRSKDTPDGTGGEPKDDGNESVGPTRKTADDVAVSEYASDIVGVRSGDESGDFERASSAESVLVLGPTGLPISRSICSEFLVGERGSRDVLFVTFEDSPGDRMDICHRTDEWAGGEIGIIEVGRGSSDSPVTSEISGGGTIGSITVKRVSKPSDLSKLGIVITKLLAEFDETPRQTVLCFHTLSALHGQVGTKTLFRFLTTLQGRLRSADAVGHYHMDPDLHDEIVIETLRPIFDVLVRFSDDGTIELE